MLFSFLALFTTLAIFAAIDPNAMITLILPLVVWLATWAVNWAKEKLGKEGFSGTVVVTLIVPILSWISAEVYILVDSGVNDFWALFGLGLLGTFVNEIVKQWSQEAKKVQTVVKSKLIG